MPEAVSVLAGVSKRRRVATTNMATREAQPQVHPGCTERQALRATVGSLRDDWADHDDMWIMNDGHGFVLPIRSASLVRSQVRRLRSTDPVGSDQLVEDLERPLPVLDLRILHPGIDDWVPRIR
jgi:hypothetical protein